MYSRYRSPGNGYRSSSFGMLSGVAAPSRIPPESSIRGQGMFNVEYRGYSHGFGRGQPRQTPTAPPPDIFAEAGRLATEYLVSKGVLPPDVLTGKWLNGSLKTLLADCHGFRPQGDILHLPRTRNGTDLGSGKRRVSEEYSPPNGSKSYSRDKRRSGFSKSYRSDLGREMGRSSSFSERPKPITCKEEEGVDNGAGKVEQSSIHLRESRPISDGSGDSQFVVENFQNRDDIGAKASSSSTGKDLPAEAAQQFLETLNGIRPVDEETADLKHGSDGCQVEKLSSTKDVSMLDCATEDESMNKSGNDVISPWKFMKVPTKMRSSLTTKVSKGDLVPITEKEKDIDQLPFAEEKKELDVVKGDNGNDGPLAGSEVIFKGVPVDASSINETPDQIEGSKCAAPDSLIQTPEIVPGNVEELAMGIESKKRLRSQSFPCSTLMNEQEPSEDHTGFGRCSSMIMERGEKRDVEYIDNKEKSKKPREWDPTGVTQMDEYLYPSQSALVQELPAVEGGRSPVEKVGPATGKEMAMVVASLPKDGIEQCIESTDEKQLFPSSFKICDLNIEEASQRNGVSVPDPILLLPSVTGGEKVVDLSTSSNTDISGRYDRRGADGKEIEVIDLDNDSLEENNAFKSSERKDDAVFMVSEGFPDHAQSDNDIADVQDNYGLMISDFLGNDIAHCSEISADINSMQNEMALHSGEGILGDDESIYMSLGEIPISMPEI